jgi:hypothetical protein
MKVEKPTKRGQNTILTDLFATELAIPMARLLDSTNKEVSSAQKPISSPIEIDSFLITIVLATEIGGVKMVAIELNTDFKATIRYTDMTGIDANMTEIITCSTSRVLWNAGMITRCVFLRGYETVTMSIPDLCIVHQEDQTRVINNPLVGTDTAIMKRSDGITVTMSIVDLPWATTLTMTDDLPWATTLIMIAVVETIDLGT